MDRRFLAWLLVSASLCFLWVALQQRFQPPPADADAGVPQAANAEQINPPADDSKDSNNPKTPEPKALQIGGPAPAEGVQKVVAPNYAEKLVTLGSMDPAAGYDLLVAISSRGAGVERIELVTPDSASRFSFRALEQMGGYLGYLGCQPSTAGLKIYCVPPGSPAELATSATVAGGLSVGDVLKSFNAQSVETVDQLQKLLDDTKSGAKAIVEVVRQIDGAPQTLNFTVTLSQTPLDILRTQEHSAEQVYGNIARASCLTTIAAIDSLRIAANQKSLPGLESISKINWEVLPLVVPGGQGVEFRLPLDAFLSEHKVPNELDLVKRFRLLPTANSDSKAGVRFSLDLETLVVNRSQSSVELALRQDGLSGLTLEGWWYSVKVSPYFFRGAGQRDVLYSTLTSGHSIRLNRDVYDAAIESPLAPDRAMFGAGESSEARTLKYIGVDAQYFAAAMVPHPEHPNGLANLYQAASTAIADVPALPKSQTQATNVSFWFDTESIVIPPGQSKSTHVRIFAGPKDPTILASYGLERFIEYGWFPMIAKPLSWVLQFFYGIVWNYGLAIIMLTVVVRACMFPLGRQAAINAQRMQELQPELKKINDLYKDNMEKRAKAMQELYAKHNFRPLSGCLPLFIQIPIFIGLYRCLSVDISLRQQALIPGIAWCSNLAGPDLLADWSSWMPQFFAGRGVGWLGPYFNILPVLTVVQFLVQQKMLMPKATDEQTQMTQTMMQYMTLFMGVLFFKVPSGLCIYFITSSLWSLAERQLVKRLVPPRPPGTSSLATSPASPAGSGTTSTSSSRSQTTSVNSSTSNARENARPANRPPVKLPAWVQKLQELLEKPGNHNSTHRNDANIVRDSKTARPNKPQPENPRDRKSKKRRK